MRFQHSKPILSLAAIVFAVAACSDGPTQPRADADLPLALIPSASASMAVDFTLGPLVPGSAPSAAVPGSSGRFHFRDFLLLGPVAGDLVGSVEIVLNGNLSAFVFAPGSEGPLWGTVKITTAEGIWSGELTGELVNQQGFSDMVLQGPAQQTIRASCAETTPTSETNVCTGELVSPHG